jgi:hypothetical protein
LKDRVERSLFQQALQRTMATTEVNLRKRKGLAHSAGFVASAIAAPVSATPMTLTAILFTPLANCATHPMGEVANLLFDFGNFIFRSMNMNLFSTY